MGWEDGMLNVCPGVGRTVYPGKVRSGLVWPGQVRLRVPMNGQRGHWPSPAVDLGFI